MYLLTVNDTPGREAGSGTVGSTAVGWTVTVSASVSGAAAVSSAIFMT